MRKILGFAIFVLACGGSVASPADAGDAGIDVGLVCECSGSPSGGPGITVTSGGGSCGGGACADECGHQWGAFCSTMGEWTCMGAQMPVCAMDAGSEPD